MTHTGARALSLLALAALLTLAQSSTPWVVKVATSLPAYAPVPRTFTGLSIEWTNLDSFTDNAGFSPLMALVSGGKNGALSIRIGGNSQDNSTTPATPAFWNKLAQLATATGCQYIIGLNLKANNVALAVLQTQNAIKYLPKGSIYGFEIGNEPDRYQYLGWRPAGYITSARYMNETSAYLDALAPVWVKAFGTMQMLAGPSLSVSLAWTVNQMKAYVSAYQQKGFLKVVTTHKYITAASSVRANVTTLSFNDVVVQYAKDIGALRGVATSYRLPFRVDEMGSFSQGGESGTSNTVAGGLWALDQALYMAEQGTAGVNFHGGGCAWYSAVIQCLPNPGLTISPTLYSLLMLQAFTGGAPTFVPSAITYNSPPVPLNTVSAYAVMNLTTGAARVLIINKNQMGASISVNVQLGGSFSSGKGVYLVGPSPSAISGATFGGQTVQSDGSLTGVFQASYPAPSSLGAAALPAAIQSMVANGTAAAVSFVQRSSQLTAGSSQFFVIVPPSSAVMLIATP